MNQPWGETVIRINVRAITWAWKVCLRYRWIKADSLSNVCLGEHELQRHLHGFHHRQVLQMKVVCRLSKKFKKWDYWIRFKKGGAPTDLWPSLHIQNPLGLAKDYHLDLEIYSVKCRRRNQFVSFLQEDGGRPMVGAITPNERKKKKRARRLLLTSSYWDQRPISNEFNCAS